MKVWGLWIVIFASFVSFAKAQETSPFTNLEYYLQNIRYERCEEFSGERVKIAIIENAFPEDISQEKGVTLPEDMVSKSFNTSATLSSSKHGLYVAQLVYLLTTRGGRCPEISPEIYLFAASGYTALNKAIQEAIHQNVDFILNNNVYEYHGFSDGKGVINSLVNQAIDHGITWINAAGNFQGKIYQDKIMIKEDRWLTFSTQEDRIRLYCPKTSYNQVCDEEGNCKTECNAKIVVQWNDFKDTLNGATTQDLDIELTDDVKKSEPIYSSRIQTDNEETLTKDPLHNTRYPYEMITAKLNAGVYYLRIKASSDNFNSNSQFRVILNSDFAELLSQNPNSNTVLPPADNARVITVGAKESTLSSYYYKEIQKPEFVTDSIIKVRADDLEPELRDRLTDSLQRSKFPDTAEFLGSSVSATVFASLATLIKTKKPMLTEKELLNHIEKRFLNSTVDCHYVSRKSEDEVVQKLLDTHTSSVLYPSKDAMVLLTPYNPYKYFGLKEPIDPSTGRNDFFLGVGSTGDINLLHSSKYHTFVSYGGVFVDAITNYGICD